MNIRFRPGVREALLTPPLRGLAKPVYEALTAVELRAVRIFDGTMSQRRPPPLVTEKVTAIVKTFERPHALKRLVASAQRRWPGLRIVIADDSRSPCVIPGTELVRLPFDVGVSAGRQAALERVRTEYTWNLDDDFVLYRGTRIDAALAALEAHSELDIVGGPVINLPLWLKRRSDPNAIFPTHAAPVMAAGTRIGGLEVCDKVPNFFVGRTERLRLVGWSPELKRLDHADFFTRARGTLVTAYCDEFRCLHAQTPFDRRYQEFRQAWDDDRRILAQRYSVRYRE